MNLRYGCGILLVCLMSSQVTADPQAFTVGGDMRYFDYEEFGLNGQSLNRETGFIPGLKIAGSTAWLGIDHTLEFGVWNGTVDYDGRTQAGQPHATQTDETVYRLLYRADWQPGEAEESLYAKACWQSWDRDIQPANGVSGLFERYRWWSIEAGMRVVPWHQLNRSLAFELGVLQTSHGVISIDLTENGFGRPSLNLADGLGAAVSVEYTIEISDVNRLHIDLHYASWKFGRSNTQAVTNGVSTLIITEPDSASNHITLSTSYDFRF